MGIQTLVLTLDPQVRFSGPFPILKMVDVYVYVVKLDKQELKVTVSLRSAELLWDCLIQGV